MDKNKEKVKLNDELLNKVSGGAGGGCSLPELFD